jgi:ABC-type multidrug transport system fused ATPase/permease subunit
MTLSATADAINALGRLEEVLDAEVTTDKRVIDPELEDAVVIEGASFTWDAAPPVEEAVAKLEAKLAAAQAKLNMKNSGKETGTAAPTPKAKSMATTPAVKSGAATPALPLTADGKPATDKIFQLHDINLSIKKGSLTAIVGAIGSGKSSLLQGLMGEMRRTEGKVTFSGTTALCAQTPWIQNATLRENILFGQPWDEERYWAAVRDASLETDLELLEDGDGTEIGEKGITLSGGQKQRVNIARAIYYDADIIALDDPLSALDAGVGKTIFHNALLGALAGKTRILVTHALHFLPHVDQIITIENGRISEVGTYKELRSKEGGAFANLMAQFGGDDQEEKEAEDEESAIEKEQTPKPVADRSKMTSRGVAHQLMQEEERNQGAIKGDTWSGYFKAGKGIALVPILLLSVAVAQGFTVMTSYWLIWWQAYEWGYSNNFFMGIYAALGIGSACSIFFMGFSNAMINYFASVTLHRDALKRIFFAPQSFFDTTPLGRIMNRWVMF